MIQYKLQKTNSKEDDDLTFDDSKQWSGQTAAWRPTTSENKAAAILLRASSASLNVSLLSNMAACVQLVS